jgi:hypothetical protein
VVTLSKALAMALATALSLAPAPAPLIPISTSRMTCRNDEVGPDRNRHSKSSKILLRVVTPELVL